MRYSLRCTSKTQQHMTCGWIIAAYFMQLYYVTSSVFPNQTEPLLFILKLSIKEFDKEYLFMSFYSIGIQKQNLISG